MKSFSEVLQITNRLKGDTIFLFVGESGSGKSSICDQMETQLGARQVESYTTRAPRCVHERGHRFCRDYTGWKNEHPDEIIVAETRFSGDDYWATAAQIDESDTYIVDIAGVESLKARYTGNKQIRIIYIGATALSRYVRMRKRGDSRTKSIKRLLHDWKAFHKASRVADVVFDNCDFKTCCADVKRYMLRQDGVEN